MAITRDKKHPYSEIITLCIIITFITLVSWGTATTQLLSLPSHIPDVKWWKILSYPLSSPDLLNLISEIFLLSVLFRMAQKSLHSKKITFPIIICSMAGGAVFYIISLAFPANYDNSETLSSFMLPATTYMCVLSSISPTSHITFFTPRTRLWKISTLIVSFVIILKFIYGSYITAFTYISCSVVGTSYGLIVRHISRNTSRDKHLQERTGVYMDILNKNEQERHLDDILEKISRIGYKNLSHSEKEFLRSISTKDK